MAARDWVVKHLGEATARTIEQLAGAFFGDDFVNCRSCGTLVPAHLVTEWGCCPVCREASGELTTEALLAQRDALLASHQESRMELDRIEALLAARHGKD